MNQREASGKSIFEQLLDYQPLIDHLNQNFYVERVEDFAGYFKEKASEYDKLLDQTRKKLIFDKQVSSVRLLHELKQLCESRRINEGHRSLCSMYSRLKISNDNMVSVIDNLNYVKIIPKNGLSNTEIEGIFKIYERDIQSFKWLGILTSDFMVCNVQQFFNGQELQISEDFIEKELERFRQTQNVRQINTRRAHPLTHIDADQLRTLYHQGKHHIGMVINTDWCVQGGSHWIALYLNLKKKQILLFNSVGPEEYKKNIETVKLFCQYLTTIMDQLEHGGPTELQFLEDDVQNIHNICGVYCVLFITCQMFGIPYQKVQELLKFERNRGETFVQLFKVALFG